MKSRSSEDLGQWDSLRISHHWRHQWRTFQDCYHRQWSTAGLWVRRHRDPVRRDVRWLYRWWCFRICPLHTKAWGTMERGHLCSEDKKRIVILIFWFICTSKYSIQECLLSSPIFKSDLVHPGYPIIRRDPSGRRERKKSLWHPG